MVHRNTAYILMTLGYSWDLHGIAIFPLVEICIFYSSWLQSTIPFGSTGFLHDWVHLYLSKNLINLSVICIHQKLKAKYNIKKIQHNCKTQWVSLPTKMHKETRWFLSFLSKYKMNDIICFTYKSAIYKVSANGYSFLCGLSSKSLNWGQWS